MKKTIFVLLAIAVLVSVFIAIPENAAGSANDITCCNQMFRVVDGSGNPVANCMLTISGPCGSSCQTDNNGECKMCLGTGCGDLTVTAVCCSRSVKFTPCITTPVIVVTCP